MNWTFEQFEHWVENNTAANTGPGEWMRKLIAERKSDARRWPIQPEGIGLILTESLNIPTIANKIAKAIQSGNY